MDNLVDKMQILGRISLLGIKIGGRIMAFKIGFSAEIKESKEPDNSTYRPCAGSNVPKKSLVQVQFPGRGMALAYYNDQFDLHKGDHVFVDGKLEGVLGRVVEVSYNFKIKLSEYKRVIGRADTDVHGEFHMAGSHFITFDRNALPVSKASTWFMAPMKVDDEYASGNDDSTFSLRNLNGFEIESSRAERGHEYYLTNRVRYLCIDNGKGYAIVEGTKPYEVEFYYDCGEISALTCTCLCSGSCKHEFAVLLQLKETIEMLEKEYEREFERTNYFVTVFKGTLFAFAVDGKEKGTFSL